MKSRLEVTLQAVVSGQFSSIGPKKSQKQFNCKDTSELVPGANWTEEGSPS